jgi:putative phage-type endonuclease
MKILTFDTKEDWLGARRGKITGTRLKDIVSLRGINKKIGYYELIAERLGVPGDDENAMERGARLEPEAIEMFSKETGKSVDTTLAIWCREDNESIALSPDGMISETEAIEAKCPSSARYIEALLTQEVPKEYQFQVLQYFVVNDDLQTLYMVFYDPRILAKPMFYLTITRDEVQEDVEKYLSYQNNTLKEVNDIVAQLSDF